MIPTTFLTFSYDKFVIFVTMILYVIFWNKTPILVYKKCAVLIPHHLSQNGANSCSKEIATDKNLFWNSVV